METQDLQRLFAEPVSPSVVRHAALLQTPMGRVAYESRLDAVLLKIYYHRPDKLWLLQEYVWQLQDDTLLFPRSRLFIDYWRKNMEGPLHSLEVATSKRTELVNAGFVATFQ